MCSPHASLPLPSVESPTCLRCRWVYHGLKSQATENEPRKAVTVQPISTAEDVSGGTSRVASGGGSSGGGDGGAGAASGGGFKLSLEHQHVRTEWQVTRMKASDIMALQHPREDGQSGKVHELHRRLNEDLHMALGWKKRAEVEKAQWEAQLEKRRSAEVSNLLEQYLPPRLLCGLLPAALLERHDFYQDLTKPRIIRGYPCVPVSGECSTQVDCSTCSHCFPPLSRSLPLPSRCFSLPFAAFRCLSLPSTAHSEPVCAPVPGGGCGCG